MTPEKIGGQLERILASATFARAAVHQRLLRRIVERSVVGDFESLKEACLAVDVFGRDPSDFQRDDSIVRVQAGQLRRRLEAYYAEEGARDRVRVTIPRGAYWARFERRAPRKVWGALAAAAAVVAIGCWIGVASSDRPWFASDEERARRLYEKGRALWNRADRVGLEASLKAYRAALELAPRSAATWAAIADSYNLLGAKRLIDRGKAFESSSAAITRSLAIDPDCADAHASAGFAAVKLDPARSDPEPHFRRAIALDPELGRAHLWYSSWLAVRGEFDAAIRHAQLAVSLDRASPAFYAGLGRVYFLARDAERAIEHYETAVELAPRDQVAATRLSYAYLEAGRLREAMEHVERSIERIGRRRALLMALAKARARAGDLTGARAVQEELAERANDLERALVALDVGDREDGFAGLAGLVEKGRFPRVGVERHPLMDPFREDPRFQRLVARLHGEADVNSPL